MAKPDRLTIDIVAKWASGLHHISRLTHKSNGLYDVPQTHKSTCPIDIHSSYHPSGEMHGKLTRGRLFAIGGQQAPMDEAYCRDGSHPKAKEIPMWEAKGQAWDSLKGVEEASRHNGFINLDSLCNGYPIHSGEKADYTFEVDTQSIPSVMIDIRAFLVEPGNTEALQERIQGIIDSWVRPFELLTVEKAELFTSLSPWLAVVLFTRKAKSPESSLGGQPAKLRSEQVVEQQRPRNIGYFVVKFGRAHEDDHPVDGGCYPLARKYWPSGFCPYRTDPREGDVALLYCFKNYFGDIDKMPGIGIVYGIDEGDDENALWYHYVSLSSPISGNTIRTELMRAGMLGDLHNILEAGRSQYCFLRMIQNASARALLRGCRIDWP